MQIRLDEENEQSLSNMIQRMSYWRQGRYGISEPKHLRTNLYRTFKIINTHYIAYFSLVLIYFALNVIANGALLLISWHLGKNSEEFDSSVLVQLTSNWPLRFLKSIASGSFFFAISCSMKRRGNSPKISDLLQFKERITWKLYFGIVILEIVLTSPLQVAHALFHTDKVWSLIYLVSGFLLNYFFGMAQLLLIEDDNISILSSFIWSSNIAISEKYFYSLFMTNLISLVLSPIIFFVPFTIILQYVVFYDIFGYSTPEEVQLVSNL